MLGFSNVQLGKEYFNKLALDRNFCNPGSLGLMMQDYDLSSSYEEYFKSVEKNLDYICFREQQSATWAKLRIKRAWELIERVQGKVTTGKNVDDHEALKVAFHLKKGSKVSSKHHTISESTLKGKQQDKQDALILLDEVTALCPDDESLTRKCLDAKHALYLAVGDVDAALVTKQAIRELQSTTSTNTTSTTGITTSTLYTGANSSNSISSSKRVSTNGTASYTNHHTSNYTSTSSGVSNISGRNAGMYGGDSAADPQLSSQSSNVTTSNVTTTTASTVVPQLHNNKDTISQLNYLIQLTGSSSSCKERSGIQPLRDIAAESSTCQSTAKGTKHHKHSHKHSHKHHKHHKHTHGSRSRK